MDITYQFEDVPLIRIGEECTAYVDGEAVVEFDRNGAWQIIGCKIMTNADDGPLRIISKPIQLASDKTYGPSFDLRLVTAALMRERFDHIQTHVNEALQNAWTAELEQRRDEREGR